VADERVLVLAPHPDDETVGCAGAIGRARAAGTRLFVLFLTTGVPADADAGPWRRGGYAERVERRRREAIAATARLGLERATFLSCPARRLRTGLADAAAAIAAEVAHVEPTALWAPAYEGGHQDHDVASFLASRFARRLPVVEFAEYNLARGVRSHQFPRSTGAELLLTLAPDERAEKRALLDLYRSERGNLRHVRVEREALRPLARYDYARPPHAGRLFYERFRWLPFRHPRVDSTRAEEVCAALGAARR